MAHGGKLPDGAVGMIFSTVVCADAVVAAKSSSAAYTLLIGSILRYVVIPATESRWVLRDCGVTFGQ